MTLRASKKSCLPGHSSPGVLEKEILTFINCFFWEKKKKSIVLCTQNFIQCQKMTYTKKPAHLDVLPVSTIFTTDK